MAQLDVEQLERDYKQQYVRLLDLLARIIYANKDLTVSDVNDGKRLDDAHALAFKFFGHALTVLYLSHGTNQELPSLKWHYIDPASIDVITRAALEAFLIFHHVFYASPNPEEKDYRYWAYKAEGLDNRQRIIESIGSEEEKKELRVEKNKLDASLSSSQIFQSLSPEQKRRVFAGNGMWRLNPENKRTLSWSDIGIKAGLSKLLANRVYKFLCASAHSSALGVRQTFPTINEKEAKHLYAGTAAIMNIITANLIQDYCELFARAQSILSGDVETSNLIREWIQRGSALDKLFGLEQNNDQPTHLT